MLISVWVYAYSRGIGSAREVARRCEFEPAFPWLTGLQEVNYHTLADFRVPRPKELDELFTQVLAALSREGLLTLEQVRQDGTQVRAVAGGRSFQWGSTLRGHLPRARERVAKMGDPRGEEGSERVQQARARAQREQQQRLEKALEELAELQKEKRLNRPVRVSEPEARRMKLGDGGVAPAYNLLVSSDVRRA
jgi:hypothetical protein